MKRRFNIFREQLGFNKKISKRYNNLHVLLSNSEYWWINDELELETETLLQIRNYITNYLKEINPNGLY